MNDVIIAIVPAPGHEGLVATWMPQGFRGTVERPARVIRCSCGAWACPVMADGHMLTHDDALVLYAPSGPRLGMVRAMEALEVTDCWCVPDLRSEEWRVFTGTPDCDEGVRQPNMPRPPAEVVGAGWSVYRAFAAAHLLHQRGLASEVLVLPAPS